MIPATPRLPVAVAAFLAMFGTGLALGDELPTPELYIDDYPEARNEILPHVRIGGQLRLDVDHLVNADLDADTDDDIGIAKPRPEFYVAIDPHPKAEIFLKFEVSDEFGFNRQAADTADPVEIEVEEVFLVLRDLLPHLSLIAGRQRFRDDREWLFDAEFDGGRLFYQRGRFALEAGGGLINAFPRSLNNRDRDDETVNYYAAAHYAYAPDSVATVYGFGRDDGSPDNESPWLAGLRVIGEAEDRFLYWLEAAYAGGRDGSNEISGVGVDAGLTTRLATDGLMPAITIGVAYGSGDADTGDGRDGNFRQTGLQDNNSRHGGVTSFSHYGTVLEPELSNLLIATAGFGIRPTKRSSVDLVYHHYRQVVTVPGLRDSNLDIDPDGSSADIGHALDLVIGFREIEDVRIELIGGAFFPGAAFPTSDPAFLGSFEIRYNF